MANTADAWQRQSYLKSRNLDGTENKYLKDIVVKGLSELDLKELKKIRDDAKKDLPELFVASCQEHEITGATTEFDILNIQPAGQRRSRRPPVRLVDNYTPYLVEDAEEAAAISALDEEGMTETDSESGDTVSDGGATWKPTLLASATGGRGHSAGSRATLQ